MKIKTICIAIPLLLLTACTTIYSPEGTQYRRVPAQWTVVNNTGVQIDIFNGGIPIAKNVETGQVMPIPQTFFVTEAVITVVAHTAQGQYVGTNSRRFLSTEATAWTVNTLDTP